MPIITVLLYVLASASTAARRLKPRSASVAAKISPAAMKYAATGRRLSCSTCTVLMVRNSSAGASSRKIRFDRSLTAAPPTQLRQPGQTAHGDQQDDGDQGGDDGRVQGEEDSRRPPDRNPVAPAQRDREPLERNQPLAPVE